MLADNLGDFLGKFGTLLAEGAAEKLMPLYRPGIDTPPDLSVIEHLRTSRHPACIHTGNPFRFFQPQVERIAGTVATLKNRRTAWMIEEMACGKTAQAIAVAWLKLKHKKNYRIIVMCPGHLTRKWKREVEWLLPNIDCKIIKTFQDLKAFQNAARQQPNRPMAAVAGKDTLKLGIELDHPCAARRKMAMKTGGTYTYVDIAVCPRCWETVTYKDENDVDQPYGHKEYTSQHTVVWCKNCGDKQATNYSPPNRTPKPRIYKYIQRHMKGVFDMLIADEVHELASADSAQGNAFGTIGSACKYVLALTGTLIGGKASDLHAPLWRMAPELMRQRGFALKHRNGKRSAVGRNERTFTRKYGVMEHKVLINAHNGKVRSKSEERPKPGISPDLFNHFLLDNAVFMSLHELGSALPPLERELVPVQPSPELAQAYRFISQAFSAAMMDRTFKGRGPPLLAMLRVMVLDAYLDRPFGWAPVQAPAYQNGVRIGKKIVVQPPDVGDLHQDGKDKKLLEIIQRELAAGRRCAIYPQYTGVHDVREKMLVLLERNRIRAMALPDKIKPDEREDWIERNVSQMDVLIAHPKRVMTGLDLIQFPSLIWYQCGYSTHVLRQASARARRPTQTMPCRVIFLYYANTVQEVAMSLMGEKEAASQMLEGVFDTTALRALMNGGECDDILTALANRIGETLDAKSAWSKVQDIAGVPEEHHEQFIFDQTVEDFLFDMKEEVIF